MPYNLQLPYYPGMSGVVVGVASIFTAARADGGHPQGAGTVPGEYPRDTDVRRQIMAGFSGEINAALNEPAWIADDRSVDNAMANLAKIKGYWPGG